MSGKKIYYGVEARERIGAGVGTLQRIVGSRDLPLRLPINQIRRSLDTIRQLRLGGRLNSELIRRCKPGVRENRRRDQSRNEDEPADNDLLVIAARGSGVAKP